MGPVQDIVKRPVAKVPTRGLWMVEVKRASAALTALVWGNDEARYLNVDIRSGGSLATRDSRGCTCQVARLLLGQKWKGLVYLLMSLLAS
jgi:hypothetical protein